MQKYHRRHIEWKKKYLDEKSKNLRYGAVSEYLIMEKGITAPFWLACTFQRRTS